MEHRRCRSPAGRCYGRRRGRSVTQPDVSHVVVLGQRLGLVQIVAVCCVIAATAGTVASGSDSQLAAVPDIGSSAASATVGNLAAGS